MQIPALEDIADFANQAIIEGPRRHQAKNPIHNPINMSKANLGSGNQKTK